MALPNQKLREMVFQMLYGQGYSPGNEDDVIQLFMHELEITKRSAKEAFQKVQNILKSQSEIDDQIRRASTEYQFERISSVEKNILRLGIFELCYDKSIPSAIVIAEAVRMCRKFGSPESANFVNAILDGILKSTACASTSGSKPENP